MNPLLGSDGGDTARDGLMARPLRIEYPGACYHVMSRGSQRSRVFHGHAHYVLFLKRLGEAAQIHDVAVYCYCLMPNHYRLYLRTRRANLSRFMQGFQTAFCITMNRQRRRSGHIFQGRFKANLVEHAGYRAELSPYIHLNPIRITPLRGAGLTARRKALEAFPWSSFGAYIGVREAPAWLETGAILSGLGRTRSSRMQAYRRFVEAGPARDVRNPFQDLREQTILGSEGFVDRVRRELLMERHADRREAPALVHFKSSFSPDQVAAIVADVCGMGADVLLKRRSPHRMPRRLLRSCVARYCRHERSMTALARSMSVGLSGLAAARDRMATALASDRRLQRLVRQVEQRLKEGGNGGGNGSGGSGVTPTLHTCG